MRKFCKSSICMVLILVFLASSILVLNTISASAEENTNSNDRIATYIKLAKDGEVTDGDASSMTEDQLRFLGIYLSNFYVPFGTEIGTTSTELAESTKKDMINTLKQKFAFSDKLSKSIVETIFGYTRSSLKDLKFYVKSNSKTYTTSFECNYYNYFHVMCGRLDFAFDGVLENQRGITSQGVPTSLSTYIDDDLIKGSDYFKDDKDFKKEVYPKDKVNKFCKQFYSKYKSFDEVPKNKKSEALIMYKLRCGAFKYIYLGYNGDNGKKVFVADACTTQMTEYGKFPLRDSDMAGTSDYTASQLAFFKALESTNQLDKGYGTAFFDFNTAETDADKLSAKADKGTINGEEADSMSMLSIKMKVDCFGDIIRFGANHKVIVVPGCINPYIWQPVDSKGNDKGSAGSMFNIANAICMAQASITNGVKSGKSVLVRKVLNKKDYYFNFESFNKCLKELYSSEGSDESQSSVAMKTISGSTDVRLYKSLKSFWKVYAKYIDKKEKPKMSLGWYDHMQSWFGDQTEDADNVDLGVPRSNSGNSDQGYIGVVQTTAKPVLKKVVFIDNLGTYVKEDGSSPDYSSFHVADFLNDEGTITEDDSDAKFSEVTFGKEDFNNLYSKIESGKMDVPTSASEQALSTLYVTYCWAGLYDNDNKESTIGRLGYRIYTENLPTMGDSPLSLEGSESDKKNEQLDSIQGWIYYLLHPTEGYSYFKTLITNKVNHLLLGWHSDMTGTNGVGITTGTTKYRSNMGYVTMPDLSEIKWTDSLINLYNDCLPFLIILLIIIMLISFISGILNLQHAILGVLLFSVFALLPVNIINASVEQSNRVSQNIYGEKFTYWALVQQESYATAIDEAANAKGSKGNGSYDNYLRTLYNENQKVYTNQGTESIIVKWQAPKKMASLVLTDSDAKSVNGLSKVGQDMMYGMLNRSYGGQSYVDDEESVYMYRSYLDLSNFSRYIYNGLKENIKPSTKSLDKVSTTNWKANILNKSKNKFNTDVIQNEYKDYIDSGYTNGTDFNNSSDFSEQFYLTVPMSSNIINDALKSYGKVKTFKTSSDMIDINSDVFNFGIPMFTNKSAKFNAETMEATGNIKDTDRKKELEDFMSKYTDEDFSGLAAYSLYSENPYYYFSWKLYADGLDSGSSKSGSTGYKNLLLGQDDGGFFYNTKGNGGLKDFMNMKGLFTYIIPYLKQCNDIVREWDDTYGIFVYDGVPTEEGHWDEVKNDKDLKQKYWHNLNVTRLYDIYSPWVDVMYDCSYSKAENITVMGKQYTIEDPINPASYPKERPMIFSESEMSDYGLTEADLTQVEKNILKCNESFQERMYELLNYYNFSDVTLNSASAINCAFAFNSTFSENGVFEDNHNIYPQSFDLSNFSYDAFLRLILANSTDESLVNVTKTSSNSAVGESTGDFYENIVNNSSILTVVIMLILDVLSIYLIPAFKIFFLIALFFGAIMIILISAFKIEDNSKFIRKVLTQFFLPLILFFLATIGFSMAISLFMGVGNDEVTQSNGVSISMGDPVITMLIMIAMDLILLFIYWKIIKSTLRDIKHQAKLIGGFGSAIGGAAIGMIAGAVAAGTSGVQNATSRGVSAYRRHKKKKLDKSNNEALQDISHNTQQEGTGVENPRANERGYSGAVDTSEDIAMVRDIDSDRREIATNTQSDEASTKEKTDDINKKVSDGCEHLANESEKNRHKVKVEKIEKAQDSSKKEEKVEKAQNSSKKKDKEVE